MKKRVGKTIELQKVKALLDGQLKDWTLVGDTISSSKKLISRNRYCVDVILEKAKGRGEKLIADIKYFKMDDAGVYRQINNVSRDLHPVAEKGREIKRYFDRRIEWMINGGPW